MQFSDRDLRLLLLAIDHTQPDIQLEASVTGVIERQDEADDMERLYKRVLEEITYRSES